MAEENDKKEKVEKIVARLKDIPTLPTVVQKIIQIVDSPTTSASDLNKAILMDQALSVKVLKLVNSAFYGFPKKIETLTQAIVILGFNTVRSLALSISMVDMFSKSGRRSLNYKEFWKHAIATSIMSRMIAKKAFPSIAEEAFVSGLLHDIGILVLDQFLGNDYTEAYNAIEEEGMQLYRAEKKHLGISHPEAGSMLAEKWNLPDPLIYSIKYHHDPSPDKDYFPLVSTIHVANIGVKILKIGGVGDESLYRSFHINEESRQILRIDIDFPDNHREAMEKGMKEGEDFIEAITNP